MLLETFRLFSLFYAMCIDLAKYTLYDYVARCFLSDIFTSFAIFGHR